MSSKIIYVDNRPAVCPICSCAIKGSPLMTTIFCNMCGTKIVIGKKEKTKDEPVGEIKIGEDKDKEHNYSSDYRQREEEKRYSFNNDQVGKERKYSFNNNGMKLLTLECPNCYAPLEETPNMGILFCKYCGQKIIVEDMQDLSLKLKLREMELKHEEEKKKLEEKRKYNEFMKKQEEAEKVRKRALILLVCTFPLIFLCFVPYFLVSSKHDKRVEHLTIVENEVQNAIQQGNYDYALVKVNELRLDDDYSSAETEAWDAKREDYTNTINELMAKEEQDIVVVLPDKSKVDTSENNLEETTEGMIEDSQPEETEVEVESIEIVSESNVVGVDEKIQLNLEYLPENATKPDVEWKSEDESIAKVNTAGKVTGIGLGKTVITATASNGISTSYEVVVDGWSQEMNVKMVYSREDDNNIGNEWSNYHLLNGSDVPSSMTVSLGDELTFFSHFCEDDTKPDIGEKTLSYKVTENDMSEGFTCSYDVYVTENGGRNSGKSAHFIVTFTFTPK